MPNGTIAIVDECPILRDTLTQICADHGYGVAGCGESAEDAIQLATEEVDVLVLDLTMHGALNAISTVRVQCSTIKIIAWAPVIGTDDVVRAIEAGACGCVSKKATAEDFMLAVRTVQDGQVFVTPSVAPRSLTSLRDERPSERAIQTVNFNMRDPRICGPLSRSYGGFVNPFAYA